MAQLQMQLSQGWLVAATINLPALNHAVSHAFPDTVTAQQSQH
jgi:hypothetical protein